MKILHFLSARFLYQTKHGKYWELPEWKKSDLLSLIEQYSDQWKIEYQTEKNIKILFLDNPNYVNFY